MNKAELKKILKPLIKECIKEVIFEDSTLSTIISEVIKGTGAVAVIKESTVPKTKTTTNFQSGFLDENRTARKKQQLHEQKKKMLDAVGKNSYNGVDLFEGTTPLRSSPTTTSIQSPGILDNVEPGDSGVDLSKLGISNNIMKKMIGK